MIDPLCVATRGLINAVVPEAVATRGYFCSATAVVVQPGGGYVSRTVVLPDVDRTKIPYEQLVREDEELLILVVSAISEGMIP